ncbi:amino acid ABC transporter permease [Laribacter hongkongensis]|uniref:Glutamate ABC transporter permease n=1 Tax=Laribacter hongkongensis TaxID=168471 RepID=A0A248LDK3_9NEIS|nr:amino acid ABC transporter permease [Laribacter hongkongensis]ASJ22860.1 glutamate ABC transporter permease [Laribacter hongkongensis]MCG9040615.1 amino acid ABC transporter permease [Laribacter hongkongensis]MCG9067765.1 amino acid ABC transporter permease [Laribacter hongkongensis]MCG9089659.1 amino acid ABC transporter permease [Laribacter hongkongensis]MCG9097282.1 amino acid ABC transporter permease [Laribacter hongkongensis]
MNQYQWNWGVILQGVPDTEEFYYQWLLSGLGWTIATALCAWVIALVIGTLVGVGRTVPNKAVSGLTTAYVELFRNVPLIVQMFLWFFVFPEFLPETASNWVKQSMPLPAFSTAVIALGFYTSARVAEQVRTGILTLSRGQKNAGLALGLTLGQTYRYVMLPMAFRIIVPPLTSEFMNIFKNSAVALAIGLTELTFQMRQMTGEYAPANPIEVMTYTSLLYLIVAFSVNRIMALVEKKVQVPGYIGGGK